MVLPKLGSPLGILTPNFLQHVEPRIELDAMALTVIEGNGFNALVRSQCVCQTGGGILTTGKKDEGCGVHTPMLGDCGLVQTNTNNSSDVVGISGLADFGGRVSQRFSGCRTSHCIGVLSLLCHLDLRELHRLGTGKPQGIDMFYQHP